MLCTCGLLVEFSHGGSGSFDMRAYVGRIKRTRSEGSTSTARIRRILDSTPYHFLVYAAIVLQAASLMLEGYAMRDTRAWLERIFSATDTLVYVQVACNVFFSLELTLLFAEARFSLRRFARESGNLFWSIIHFLGTAGLILSYVSDRNLLPASFERDFPLVEFGKAFKALVSVRLARLMVFLPTLNHILLETVNAMSSISNIFVFLFLCNFCSAVVGLYLIGDTMQSRSNYSNLTRAMLTSFQIFSADSYTAVLYDAMAAGENQFWAFANALFLLTWLGFSNFVIGNLFIATIVTHIQVKNTMDDIASEGMKQRFVKKVRRSYKKLLAWKNGAGKSSWVHQTSQRMISIVKSAGSGRWSPLREMRHRERRGKSPARVSDPASSPVDLDHDENHHRFFPELKNVPYDKLSDRMKMTIRIVQDTYRDTRSPDKQGRKVSEKELSAHTHIDFEEPVLCGFTNEFGPRQLCIYLDQHPAFDAFIFLVILISCLVLILTPQYEDVPGDSIIISYQLGATLNMAFTFVFLLELVVRTMSRGFSNTRHAYLSTGWNRLDFGILVFAVVDLLNILPSAGAGKVFRSARILSPLRAIKRNEGMRILIDAFIGTLQPILYVLAYTGVAYTVASLHSCPRQAPFEISLLFDCDAMLAVGIYEWPHASSGHDNMAGRYSYLVSLLCCANRFLA